MGLQEFPGSIARVIVHYREGEREWNVQVGEERGQLAHAFQRVVVDRYEGDIYRHGRGSLNCSGRFSIRRAKCSISGGWPAAPRPPEGGGYVLTRTFGGGRIGECRRAGSRRLPRECPR